MATLLSASERADCGEDRTAFHVAVWNRIVSDPELAGHPWRIETDEHGQMIMSLPPTPSHGSLQGWIYWYLRSHMSDGEVITECPISTSKGVKAADVAWCSEALWKEAETAPCFRRAPEICVEVISPSNTGSEIAEKMRLYFQAGAREVWLCSENGQMRFHFDSDAPSRPGSRSALCPEFPEQIRRGGQS